MRTGAGNGEFVARSAPSPFNAEQHRTRGAGAEQEPWSSPVIDEAEHLAARLLRAPEPEHPHAGAPGVALHRVDWVRQPPRRGVANGIPRQDHRGLPGRVRADRAQPHPHPRPVRMRRSRAPPHWRRARPGYRLKPAPDMTHNDLFADAESRSCSAPLYSRPPPLLRIPCHRRWVSTSTVRGTSRPAGVGRRCRAVLLEEVGRRRSAAVVGWRRRAGKRPGMGPAASFGGDAGPLGPVPQCVAVDAQLLADAAAGRIRTQLLRALHQVQREPDRPVTQLVGVFPRGRATSASALAWPVPVLLQ
jgi:hypothetical protein